MKRIKRLKRMKKERPQSYLFITCFSGMDRQFNGIRKALKFLSKREAVSLLDWNSHSEERAVNLWDRMQNRNIENVLISGHGLSTGAGVGDNRGKVLMPHDLELEGFYRLYLLCCFQGKKKILNEWSSATGLEMSNISGCEGETETALSTIFFMHLIEEGLDSLPDNFTLWHKMNERLRPYFPYIRKTYEEENYNPVSTLKKTIMHIGPLSSESEFEKFIAPIERHSGMLENLSSE